MTNVVCLTALRFIEAPQEVYEELLKAPDCPVTRNGTTYYLYVPQLAKAYALVKGYRGRRGGWIYAPNGRKVAQGWNNLFRLYRFSILEWIREERSKYVAAAEYSDHCL